MLENIEKIIEEAGIKPVEASDYQGRIDVLERVCQYLYENLQTAWDRIIGMEEDIYEPQDDEDNYLT